MPDDTIGVLIRDADPALLLCDADLDRALDAIGERIMAKPASPQGKRRVSRRRVAVGVTLAAVLAAGAPAAANWVSARSGWFGDPHHTEEDASEWIRLDSPELREIVSTDVRNLGFELPGEVSPADVVSGVLRRVTVDGDTGPRLMQEGALRNVIGWEVACRWGTVWLDSADAPQATSARARMAEIASRVDALPAARGSDDEALRQQLRVNCDVEAGK
ncbi:MAG TPA: hypothetical protein VFA94_10760 [Acidimicrobiales bacterium]|nr:hypothetical protein [Acidimicrobiales bacterium]